MKKHVSSAYCLILVVVLLPCGVMPRSVDASARILSPCTTIAKSRGKRLSPCLPPPGSLNPGECLPLMINRSQSTYGNPNSRKFFEVLVCANSLESQTFEIF